MANIDQHGISLQNIHSLERRGSAITSGHQSNSESIVSEPRGRPLPEERLVDDTPQLLPATKKRQLWVLISAFLTICMTVGLNQSYGAFQVAYASSTSTTLEGGDSNATALIAFVGTLSAGLTWAGSVLVNPWMARARNIRWITMSGALCMSLGLALASLASKVYQLLLTQGLIFGIGSSMLYYPILSTAPEYFNVHRGVAMGFVFSGGGLGAVVFSPLIEYLIAHIGVGWTLRALSLVNLLISTPLAWTASQSRFPGRRPTHISRDIARKPTFIFNVAGALMLSAGNLIPLTFLSDYSIALGYSAGFGAALISVNNGVNAASRILLGFAGDRVGRQNALNITVIGSAVAIIGLWLASVKNDDKTIWLVFVVVYGIWAGGYSALFPTTVADVYGLQAYASVNGFIYLVRGLGSMFGSPVAGALLTAAKAQEADNSTAIRSSETYATVVYFDAALMFGASLCVAGVRYFDAREHGTFKLKA